MPGIRLNQVSPDPARARSRYRYKVEAGAGFALTQPVYDATLLQAFLEDNGEHRIPVLAVLRPLGSTEEAEFLANEVPGHEVPASVRSRLAEAEARGGPAAAKEEGVRITLEILEALMVDAPWTDWIRGIYLTGQTPVTELTSIVQAIRQREAQAVRNPHA
jgi:homocysteine S-methyltransferase